jgi:hypothetical protein
VDHDFDRHERYRTSVERYIYVIEFASRTVKVGQTKDAPKRLADHVKSATIHRDRVVRSWFSEPHLGYQENERALIDYCARKWTLVTGHEFFLEADFDDVVAYAQGLPFRRLSSAQIIEALAEADRRAEDRSAYFAEIRSLAELKKATDSAAHRIGLIASLANQDNRWQASDATFETLKDLYAVVPAPWAQNDPTATQRYLIACGAPAETAMLAAPEFERGMRTLYAMTRFKEPESFEDLARFCSPFMAGEAR